MSRTFLCLLSVMLLSTGALANDDKDAVAAPKQCPELQAKTVFVADKSLRRHDGSAKAVTEAHQEAEAEGWSFADMEIYTENNDLQGFLITYTRPHPCNQR